MNSDTWQIIWIVTSVIVIPFVIQFGSAWWQIKAARELANPIAKQTPEPNAPVNQINNSAPLKFRWGLRVFFAVVQFIAGVILLEAAQSSEPLTRMSALLMISMAGIMVICIIIPIIMNVYYYLDSLENR